MLTIWGFDLPCLAPCGEGLLWISVKQHTPTEARPEASVMGLWGLSGWKHMYATFSAPKSTSQDCITSSVSTGEGNREGGHKGTSEGRAGSRDTSVSRGPYPRSVVPGFRPVTGVRRERSIQRHVDFQRLPNLYTFTSPVDLIKVL